MKKIVSEFYVHKFVLNNGLTVLIRPTYLVPQVDIQLCYNVGSKDENNQERGMAHLIEHMLFKGTHKLSEIDINLITHKLSGCANAFTSHDYTSYVFKFPSNAWEESLYILADCMVNARFDEQMLASEILAVIQEMKMYKDDYHSTIVENMDAMIFQGHPYQYPVIGYKQHLCSLTRSSLYQFYKKHYHPGNATLVIVGDVDVENAYTLVKKHFDHIPSATGYEKYPHFFNDDVASKRITLYREVQTPSCYYAYVIPGMNTVQGHLFDMAATLLGGGKSSRLYELLVNKLQLASEVETFTYDMFEKGLLLINVQVHDERSIDEMETHLNNEIEALAREGFKDWEFEPAYNRIRFELAALLESTEEQATLIGSSYLATGDERYLEKYVEKVKTVTKEDVLKVFKNYIKKTVQHKGYVLAIPDDEKDHLARLQNESDELDQLLLSKFKRTVPIEPGKAVNKVVIKKPVDFEFPKPQCFTLSNGMEVYSHHSPHTPQITLLVHLKANYTYDPEHLSGLSDFFTRMLLEGTKKHSEIEIHKMLEHYGIYISPSPGLITVQLLPEGLEKALEITAEILTQPLFDNDSIEKVRTRMVTELKEYWDTPSEFVEQIARNIVYQGHPFSKSDQGTVESVQAITRQDLISYHQQFSTPQEAVAVIVGDLSGYTKEQLHALFEKKFKVWQGRKVFDLVMPPLCYEQPSTVDYEINRDQIVLGFTAPSLSRHDKDFDALAVADVVLTSGPLGSMHSRLFNLREQSGLFYTIFGSLIYEPKIEPGMMFVKTIVSVDKMEIAKNLIKETVHFLGKNGVSQEEFEIARNVLMNASVGFFESTLRTAHTFLYLKRCKLGFNLFDKRGKELSILTKEKVNEVAKKNCKPDKFSVIRIGRVK